MKILLITASYPPDHSGGYGIRIKNIMDGLSQRGYEILVLTNKPEKKFFTSEDVQNYPIIRKLHNRYNAKFFPKEIFFDLIDTKLLTETLTTFKPDVIYLGHIYILSKMLLPLIAKKPSPILFDEGGANLKGAWTERGRWFRFTGDYGKHNFIIRLMKPLAILLVQWLSQGRMSSSWYWPENMRIIINNLQNLEKDRLLGIPMSNATVIPSGIDLDIFTYNSKGALEQPVKIICPGRLETGKGVLDSLDLVAKLREARIDASLNLVGPKSSNDYQQELNERITALGILENVDILDMVSQKELVNLYHVADICFFPTYHKMGFSRTPLEAMACGCVVISYGNEGSDEIIRHGENGFLVSPKDYDNTIKIISNLLNSPMQYERVVMNARQHISENYTLEKYVDRVEIVINDTVRSINQ